MRKSILAWAWCLATVPAAGYAQGATGTFQLGPPPVPWHEFRAGEIDLRAGASYLRLTGTPPAAQDPTGTLKTAITGIGANTQGRYAANDRFALDFGAAAFRARGNVGPAADMDLLIITAPFGLEFQPLRTPQATVLLFAGYSLNRVQLIVDYHAEGETLKMNVANLMLGPQAGAQYAIRFADFSFTPFILVSLLAGESRVSANGSLANTASSGATPSSLSVLYGLDLVYLPAGVTLSSALKENSKNDAAGGYKTVLFTLSYNFGRGVEFEKSKYHRRYGR